MKKLAEFLQQADSITRSDEIKEGLKNLGKNDSQIRDLLTSELKKAELEKAFHYIDGAMVLNMRGLTRLLEGMSPKLKIHIVNTHDIRPIEFSVEAK